MATILDYMIFILLLMSFVINIIAIGAFRVSPGLQTMANRFVINLLIVNMVGCLVLVPTLFLNVSMYENKEVDESSIAIREIGLKELSVKENRENDVITRKEKLRNCTIFGGCQTYTKIFEDNEDSEKIVIKHLRTSSRNINDDQKEDIKRTTVSSSSMDRYWTIDLAAALGALSVLLVVGDTWCAVTDPLRYHTRISNVRSWILISIVWCVSILTGIMSALRSATYNRETKIQVRYDDHNVTDGVEEDVEDLETMSITSVSDDLYNIVFSAAFFVIIILVPFVFVCGMYWRIISEARENGLRMRKNGSSPLLQSAGNLSLVQKPSLTSTDSTSDGLNMRIDKNYYSNDIIINISCSGGGVNSMPINKSTSVADILESDSNNNNNTSDIRDKEDGSKTMRHVNSSPDLSSLHLHELHHHQLQHLNRIDEKGVTARSSSINSNNMLQIPSENKSPSGSCRYIMSLRHRLSNASSLFKYREESRAARISSLVIIFYLITYIPYGLLVLFQGRVITDFMYAKQLTIFLVTLAYISGPFIFAYRNKRVRRGIRRLFRLKSQRKNFIKRQKNCSSNSSNNIVVNSGSNNGSNNNCKYLSPNSICSISEHHQPVMV
ncbi:GPRHIS family protein [Megaselia abdita]